MTKPKFYVHIIESPSPADLLEGRTEGDTLRSFLQLTDIPCQYHVAVDEVYFNTALTACVLEAVKRFNLPPILHISAHGNEDGIQLTVQRSSGEIVPWDRFGKHLEPLGLFLIDPIGLCMSSCGGALARRMTAPTQAVHVPVRWIVGTGTKVNYADAALAFAAFYRGLQRGESQSDLISAMRHASGVRDFNIYDGHPEQRRYSTEEILQLLARARAFSGQRSQVQQ